MTFTHYVPYWTQEDRFGAQRTVCGIWVDPSVSHSSEPTCEACAHYLTAERAADEVVARADRQVGR